MWILHVLRGGDCVGRKENKKRKETGWKEENRISRWRGYFVVVTVWEGTKQQTKKRSGKRKNRMGRWRGYFMYFVVVICVGKRTQKNSGGGKRKNTRVECVCLKHRHCAWKMKRFGTCCNTLQQLNTLQRHTATRTPHVVHTATHCNTLQHTAAHCSNSTHCNDTLQRVHPMSSTLQHTAKHCNTLQNTATQCSNSTHCNNTLQRVHLMSYTLQHTAKLCAEMRQFDIWCTSEYTHTHRHTQSWHVSRLF